jgi:RNA 2',3'-cyclic 3'-phosphodiesterase
MRLFIALDLDDSIREKIVRFMDGVCGFAPDARWVRPESLHVTLKFIGQWPGEPLMEVQDSLQSIRTDAFEIGFGDYGFFPTAKAPRVFWIGIHSGPQLNSLAAAIDTKLSPLGIAPEEHPFSPHLTLARRAGGSGSPRKNKDDRSNQSFARLQEKLAVMSKLDFGSMTARQFFLYQSELSPGGSRYTKLSAFPLT